MSASKRHGGDCKWQDIHCKECGKWIAEWYEKGRDSKPKKICFSCVKKTSSKTRDELRYQNVKEYVGDGYFVCPETFKIIYIEDPDNLSIFCDGCDTSHCLD